LEVDQRISPNGQNNSDQDSATALVAGGNTSTSGSKQSTCQEKILEVPFSFLIRIEIKENKTPGGEHSLDPPGAELLAWF
jgi:hypothetical protein